MFSYLCRRALPLGLVLTLAACQFAAEEAQQASAETVEAWVSSEFKPMDDRWYAARWSESEIPLKLAPQQPIGPVDVAVGNLPPLGDEDAPVTLVEFSDFECPFCNAFFTDTLPQIKEEYIDTGKAKLYYRHYPLASIHPNAQITAEASECANDQGQFWAYHDLLFENQQEWAALIGEAVNEKLAEYASGLGLSVNEFNDCLTSGKFKPKMHFKKFLKLLANFVLMFRADK